MLRFWPSKNTSVTFRRDAESRQFTLKEMIAFCEEAITGGFPDSTPIRYEPNNVGVATFERYGITPPAPYVMIVGRSK